MPEYLGFIDKIGNTVDGKPIYRFDFTTDKETLWGEFFNVVPAGMARNLSPDVNTLSHQGKAIFPREIYIAKENSCYSMQDCIDGIIALGFTPLDEDMLLVGENPLVFNFGEERDSVDNKLKSIGIDYFEFDEIKNGNEDVFDGLMKGEEDTGNGEE